jgi:hypothetical protein
LELLEVALALSVLLFKLFDELMGLLPDKGEDDHRECETEYAEQQEKKGVC